MPWFVDSIDGGHSTCALVAVKSLSRLRLQVLRGTSGRDEIELGTGCVTRRLYTLKELLWAREAEAPGASTFRAGGNHYSGRITAVVYAEKDPFAG